MTGGGKLVEKNSILLWEFWGSDTRGAVEYVLLIFELKFGVEFEKPVIKYILKFW